MKKLDYYRFTELDSTNRWLLEQIKAGIKLPAVCIAGRQTNGRGRRRKAWVSDSSCNIYMSLGVQISRGIDGLSALSLVCGLAVARVLAGMGVQGVGVKWPNDIYVGQKKIAGILIESAKLAPGSSSLVIGVGLNLDMSSADVSQIDMPWTDMKAELGNDLPAKESIINSLLDSIMEVIEIFGTEGFGFFADEWRTKDVLSGRAIQIQDDSGCRQAVAEGVDYNGCLLVEIDGKQQKLNSGDVSLRLGMS